MQLGAVFHHHAKPDLHRQQRIAVMASDILSSDSDIGKAFYVYTYYDPRDGKDRCAIYVGKGKRVDGRPEWRARTHWVHGAKSNIMFQRVLDKIRELGLVPEIKIIAEFDDEFDAFALEITLIAQIGRRDKGLGPLLNMTDGGDGISGLVLTPEMIERHRVGGKNMWANASPELRKTMLSGVAWGIDPEFDANRVLAQTAGRAKRWAIPGVKEADSELIRQVQIARGDDVRAKRAHYLATAPAEKIAADNAAISAGKRKNADKIGKKSKEVWARPGMTEFISSTIAVGQKKAWDEPRGEQRRETARLNAEKQFSDPVSAEKHRLGCLERDARDGGLRARYADPEKSTKIIAKRSATVAANVEAGDVLIRDTILDQWVSGATGDAIAATIGTTISVVRRIVLAARANGDPRAIERHGPPKKAAKQETLL